MLCGSTKSCSGPSKSSAISQKPGASKGTNLSREAAFRAVVVQKNDCPCILLTGFRFVSCLITGIILLYLRYSELYSYFITFVWFLLCENVNCVLIVSPPLNAILYYVLPHRKFREAFGTQCKFLNIDIKKSLQKLMRQLHVSLFMDKL